MVTQKYFCNDNFFRDLSLESCYWAGFIAADGCINDKRVTVTQEVSRRDHILKLAKATYIGDDFADRVRDYSTGYVRKDGSISYFSCYSMNSKQYLIDLNAIYNITPAKSLTLQPPNLTDKNQILAYIAGIIDGDGTVRISNIKQGLDVLKISVTSGSPPVLDWIKSVFDDYFPDVRYSAGVWKRKTSYVYEIAGGRASKVAKEIMSLNLPLLECKWSKAITILESNYQDGNIKDRRVNIPDVLVSSIRKELANGASREDIAKMFNVTTKQIARYATGARRSYLANDGLVIPKAKRNPKELPESMVQAIKARLSEMDIPNTHNPFAKIAKEFGIRSAVIRDIYIGRTYRDVA